MINADSEKRRKTLIRVHLSTSPEAERSVVWTCGLPGVRPKAVCSLQVQVLVPWYCTVDNERNEVFC